MQIWLKMVLHSLLIGNCQELVLPQLKWIIEDNPDLLEFILALNSLLVQKLVGQQHVRLNGNKSMTGSYGFTDNGKESSIKCPAMTFYVNCLISINVKQYQCEVIPENVFKLLTVSGTDVAVQVNSDLSHQLSILSYCVNWFIFEL